MNILRVILGLVISWVILLVLFIVGLIHLAIGFVRQFFTKSRSVDPQNANALEMVRCPNCGVYTSGICVNPQCASSRA